MRLTQAEMASLLNVKGGRGGYANWEYGNSNPPEDVMSRAEDLLRRALIVREGTGEKPGPGFAPPAPHADGQSHPGVGRRLFPVLGIAGAAEFPSADTSQIDYEDWESFSDAMYHPAKERFFIRVLGHSMEDTWEDGDFALIESNPGFRVPNFYVAARHESGDLIKILLYVEGKYYLVPENDQAPYEPFEVDTSAWRMSGPVIGQKRIRNRGYHEIGRPEGLAPNRKVLASARERLTDWIEQRALTEQD